MPKATRDMDARIMLRLEHKLLERAKAGAVAEKTLDHRGLVSTSAWIREAMAEKLQRAEKSA